MGQNSHMLPGKIGKTIYVEHVVLGKVDVFQLLQHPSHLTSGIPLALLTDPVISLQDQREFFQFLGQAAFRFSRCRHQILWRDATTLELIHRIHKILQKFRLGFHRGIGL